MQKWPSIQVWCFTTGTGSAQWPFGVPWRPWPPNSLRSCCIYLGRYLHASNENSPLQWSLGLAYSDKGFFIASSKYIESQIPKTTWISTSVLIWSMLHPILAQYCIWEWVPEEDEILQNATPEKFHCYISKSAAKVSSTPIALNRMAMSSSPSWGQSHAKQAPWYKGN